jgi:hypothetical protein
MEMEVDNEAESRMKDMNFREEIDRDFFKQELKNKIRKEWDMEEERVNYD